MLAGLRRPHAIGLHLDIRLGLGRSAEYILASLKAGWQHQPGKVGSLADSFTRGPILNCLYYTLRQPKRYWLCHTPDCNTNAGCNTRT